MGHSTIRAEPAPSITYISEIYNSGVKEDSGNRNKVKTLFLVKPGSLYLW